MDAYNAGNYDDMYKWLQEYEKLLDENQN